MLMLTVPTGAYAAVPESFQPMASDYIDTYHAFVQAAGNSKVQVWFNVEGTNYVPKLGASEIKLYHSIDSQTWYLVKTYSYETTSGMMSYNDIYHSGHVDFAGVPGRFYKATVTFYGGTTTSGDYRTYNTSVILST
jgi:hypothetical protein